MIIDMLDIETTILITTAFIDRCNKHRDLVAVPEIRVEIAEAGHGDNGHQLDRYNGAGKHSRR